MDHAQMLAKVNEMCKNTLMDTLQIEFTEIGKELVKATMPVNSKVYQPFGLLHGGASAALAETVGSLASQMLIDSSEYETRGIEISANHLKSKRDGVVTAIAKNIHQGKSIHIWEIKVVDEKNQLISFCKLTNMILKKRA